MQIRIEWMHKWSGTWWENYVTENANKAATIMSSEEFFSRLSQRKKFYSTSKTVEEVVADLRGSGVVTIKVGFYSKWLTRAIAYEQDGAVYINTRKYRAGAGSAGNIAHETMHAKHYTHELGNAPGSTEGTVPRVVGDIVAEMDG